jgi:hypothetical protein
VLDWVVAGYYVYKNGGEVQLYVSVMIVVGSSCDKIRVGIYTNTTIHNMFISDVDVVPSAQPECSRLTHRH